MINCQKCVTSARKGHEEKEKGKSIHSPFQHCFFFNKDKRSPQKKEKVFFFSTEVKILSKWWLEIEKEKRRKIEEKKESRKICEDGR